MPPCSIEEQHGMGAGCDGLGDLGRLQAHGLCGAKGQHQAGALAVRWADGTEDVGRCRSLVFRRWGAGAASSSAAADRVLLPDPGLVMPPQLYVGASRQARPDRLQLGRQAFLNASMAAPFWA